jgi:tetratricopeptide (TPR) repeat protein
VFPQVFQCPPLFEFDVQKYVGFISGSVDFEFFKYLILDFDYKFTRDEFKYYIEGKKHLKNHLYSEAVKSFLKAIEATKASGYNAYVLFSIYTDIENCYKQLYDFENAYLYSSKRLSLLEGFKS